jgi:hypothetical protein
MDNDTKYQSTELYTAETFTDMGVDFVKVSNSEGMVTAILPPEIFSERFAEVVPEVTPHDEPA